MTGMVQSQHLEVWKGTMTLRTLLVAAVLTALSVGTIVVMYFDTQSDSEPSVAEAKAVVPVTPEPDEIETAETVTEELPPPTENAASELPIEEEIKTALLSESVPAPRTGSDSHPGTGAEYDCGELRVGDFVLAGAGEPGRDCESLRHVGPNLGTTRGEPRGTEAKGRESRYASFPPGRADILHVSR